MIRSLGSEQRVLIRDLLLLGDLLRYAVLAGALQRSPLDAASEATFLSVRSFTPTSRRASQPAVGILRRGQPPLSSLDA